MNAAVNKPPLGKEDLRVRLLVVDDEQSIRKLCVTVGEALGFICLEADSGESALALLEEQPVHVVLSDMVMPHMSGLEFLEKVKKLLPRTEVALMTGHGSIETAVQAMKLGAYDYITKPFSPLEELRLFLRRMAEKVRLVEENEFLRQRIDSETAVHGIVGSSAKIQEVLRVASRLKDTRTGVFCGVVWSEYSRVASASPEQIAQYTATGEDLSIVAARISYTLGLTAPSVTVSAAAATATGIASRGPARPRASRRTPVAIPSASRNAAVSSLIPPHAA